MAPPHKVILKVIVACDLNGAIAKNQMIPWHIPEDLKHFKRLTSGKVVIMGRRTWESLPLKPLPGRLNIVLSSSNSSTMDHHQDVWTLPSLDVVIERLSHMEEEEEEVVEAFVIGGAGVYKEALAHKDCQAAYVTFVHEVFDGCDVFFPLKSLTSSFKFDASTSRLGLFDNGFPFSVCSYLRRDPHGGKGLSVEGGGAQLA